MAQFQIKRGLSTSLFNEQGVCILPVEARIDGCWYITLDTHEAYICHHATPYDTASELVLKKINDVDVSSFVTRDELGDFVTITYVEEELLKKANVDHKHTLADIEDYVEPVIPTKISELENDAGYLTEHQDLSEYAKKSEIPSTEGLATEEFVTQKIAEAELNDKEVDLTAYYTKTETNAAIQSAVDAVEIPDVSNFATKDEIPNIEGLASEEFVKQQIEAIPPVDLSGYALKTDIPTDYITTEELDNRGYVTEEAVDEAIATIQLPEVPSKVSELENDSGFITIDDVPVTSLEGYATETFVTTKIAEAQLNDKEVDLSGYVTRDEMDAKTTLKYLEF